MGTRAGTRLVIHAKDLSFGAKGLYAAGAEGDHAQAERSAGGVGAAEAEAAAAIAL
jgi:hypothetical protein